MKPCNEGCKRSTRGTSTQCRQEKHPTYAGFRQSFPEVMVHELHLKKERKLAKQRVWATENRAYAKIQERG